MLAPYGESLSRRGSTGTYGLAAWSLHSVSPLLCLTAAWMVGVLQGFCDGREFGWLSLRMSSCSEGFGSTFGTLAAVFPQTALHLSFLLPHSLSLPGSVCSLTQLLPRPTPMSTSPHGDCSKESVTAVACSCHLAYRPVRSFPLGVLHGPHLCTEILSMPSEARPRSVIA